MTFEEAFIDELQKVAGLSVADLKGAIDKMVTKAPSKPGILKLLNKIKPPKFGKVPLLEDAPEAVARMLQPVKGTFKGWQEFNPRGGITPAAREKALNDLAKPSDSILGRAWHKVWGDNRHLYEHPNEVSLREIAKKKFTGPNAKALHQELAEKGQVPMFFEELGRRGYTGQKKLTKYLPVGNKSMAFLPAALELPNVIHAEKPSPTGEHGALENGLGMAGSTLGFIAGGRLGIVPNMAMSMAYGKAFQRAGRTLDRMRAGASFKDAFSAPSPTEAAKQLTDITKYYHV